MMGMDMDDCVILPWTTMKSRLKGAGQTSLSAVGTTTDTSTTSSTSASDVYTSGVSLYPKAYNTIPPVRFSNIDSMIMSEILLQACEKTEELPDKLLDKLKAGSAAMPRLYAHEESMLLPVLCLPEAQEGKVMVSGSGAFRTGSGASS